mmetsp:Transcript_31372/g.36072  ORF Transcript_31372/g.36072 Transcript_31372/m.36072 type:complete len:369 (+) Transcript_31372:164-1270(+)
MMEVSDKPKMEATNCSRHRHMHMHSSGNDVMSSLLDNLGDLDDPRSLPQETQKKILAAAYMLSQHQDESRNETNDTNCRDKFDRSRVQEESATTAVAAEIEEETRDDDTLNEQTKAIDFNDSIIPTPSNSNYGNEVYELDKVKSFIHWFPNEVVDEYDMDDEPLIPTTTVNPTYERKLKNVPSKRSMKSKRSKANTTSSLSKKNATTTTTTSFDDHDAAFEKKKSEKRKSMVQRLISLKRNITKDRKHNSRSSTPKTTDTAGEVPFLTMSNHHDLSMSSESSSYSKTDDGFHFIVSAIDPFEFEVPHFSLASDEVVVQDDLKGTFLDGNNDVSSFYSNEDPTTKDSDAEVIVDGEDIEIVNGRILFLI